MIENGEISIIWLGASVSPQVLLDLYAVENLQDLDVRMVSSNTVLALSILSNSARGV